MRTVKALFVLSLLALGLVAVPARASEGEAKKAPPYVDLDSLAIPVLREGLLVNYVFVKLRVNLTPKGDSLKFRAKAPYLRDAVVKAAHKQSLIDPKDPTRVDEKALNALVAREAGRLAGAGVVASGETLSQASQRRVVR